MVFLGTPHRGSASAWIGVGVAKFFRFSGLKAYPDIVEAVKYDSVELQDMHRHFEAISDHLRIINFYEKHKLPQFLGLWESIVRKQ